MGERLTVLLTRMRAGDKDGRDAAFAAAYQELHRLARARLYDNGGGVELNATALVHESYLRLVKTGELDIADRRAFFGYASQVMRSVIVDTARNQISERRGGGAGKVTLSTEIVEDLRGDDEGVLQVHEALHALDAVDPRMARVVEMRYFGGYSESEIADALDVNERTVQRDWEKAKALLRAILHAD